MKYTLEATAPDGSPRKLAGMFRAPFENFQGMGYVHCSCGTILQNHFMVREHWQLGHFDGPLYEVEVSP